ncbi:MAG: DUF6273 domain-containing protein [Faecousia sp.]
MKNEELEKIYYVVGIISAVVALIYSGLKLLSEISTNENPFRLVIVIFCIIYFIWVLVSLLCFNKKLNRAAVVIGIVLIFLLILPNDFYSKIENLGNTDTTDPTETTLSTDTSANLSSDTSPATEAVTVPPQVLPGSIIKLGHYEQDNRDLNGSEAIEWIALVQEENKVLAISVLGLDSLPYHKGEGPSDWSSSSVRDWLNGSFYQTAFSKEERTHIIETDIVQHKNKDYPACEQGENTTDNVFLLSAEEYIEYLFDNGNIDIKYRDGIPSAYAIEQHVNLSNGTYSWWWLRTSSEYNNAACSVNGKGSINYGQRSIHSTSGMVRPAMWVSADLWNES